MRPLQYSRVSRRHGRGAGGRGRHSAQGDGRVGVDHARRCRDRVEEVGVVTAGGYAGESGALLLLAGGGRRGSTGGGGGSPRDGDAYVGLENGGSGGRRGDEILVSMSCM